VRFLPLKDQLMADLKSAMKEKDNIKKATVTMLRAAIKQKEVDDRIELSDENIIDIIAKQIKQKKGAIEEFKKGDRQDLIDEAENEIKILSCYMPEQLSNDEIKKIVESVVSELGASTMKDMGKVMSKVKEETKGRADGKVISDMVKEILK